MLARNDRAGPVVSACLYFIGLLCLQAVVPCMTFGAQADRIQSGISNFEKGLYLKAIRELEEGIQETDSPSAESWYFLGSSFSKIGKFDQAIQAFEKAIKIDPGFTEVYLDLGISYYNKNQYERALSSFRKVIEVEPENSSALFFQGLAYQGLKKSYEAIRSFEIAGSIDKDFQQLAQFNIGLLHFKNKRYEEARLQFETCIETDPEGDIVASARDFLELIDNQKPPKPWKASFRVGGSIDDNVTLESINLTSGVGDSLSFYQFSGSYQWKPFESYSLNTGYDFSMTAYDSLHSFDLQIHSGYLSATKSFGDLDVNLGYTFNYIALGGEDFENLHTMSSGVNFELLSGWYVDVSYFLTFKSFEDIQQRDARNHSLRVSNYFSLGDSGGLLWLAYAPEGEITRDDQVTYVAQNVSAGIEYPVPLESWKTKVRASYSHTYQDYLFITPLINTERLDFRNSVSFEIIQPILKNFDLTFQYQYLNSESNLLSNDFVENIFTLSAGASF